MKKHITIVLGTARAGRNSERVAAFLVKEAAALGHAVTFVDVKEYPLTATIPGWVDDERTAGWKEIVRNTDAFLLVVPEYNHGYPGELKLLLDAAFEEYFGKQVMLAGVSKGRFGGARVVEHILPVLLELGMRPVLPALYVGNVEKDFDEEGNTEQGIYKENLVKLLGKLS